MQELYQEYLPAPRVSNAFGGKIDFYGKKNGIQLMIHAYPNARVGDTIVISWDDFEMTETLDIPGNLPYIYDVSKNFPTTCLNDGTHVVKYNVNDLYGNSVESDIAEVTVSTTC